MYNVPQVWDRIPLCRRSDRLRRLWRVAALHSRRVDLVLLKINDIFDSCTSFAGCVFLGYL